METLESTVVKQFVYSYNDHEGIKQEILVNIDIPYKNECLEELVTQTLCQMDPMMRYLDENVGMYHG